MAGKRRMDSCRTHIPDNVFCVVYSSDKNHGPYNRDACNLPGNTWSFVTLLFHSNLFKSRQSGVGVCPYASRPVNMDYADVKCSAH
ncbi:hypothetical protein C772_01794 [Bhargavaea cecembensis DSE10]|uniref:Uncharacterized protein n=1 Tax=Bhargavaea cecembensis DSE10 TaxID=1235279 RepID=M7P6J3_9BACL|nr:hypothetical protein C772_01794 [Bhargavaea cecembensis DSE10]